MPKPKRKLQLSLGEMFIGLLFIVQATILVAYIVIAQFRS